MPYFFGLRLAHIILHWHMEEGVGAWGILAQALAHAGSVPHTPRATIAGMEGHGLGAGMLMHGPLVCHHAGLGLIAQGTRGCLALSFGAGVATTVAFPETEGDGIKSASAHTGSGVSHSVLWLSMSSSGWLTHLCTWCPDTCKPSAVSSTIFLAAWDRDCAWLIAFLVHCLHNWAQDFTWHAAMRTASGHAASTSFWAPDMPARRERADRVHEAMLCVYFFE